MRPSCSSSNSESLCEDGNTLRLSVRGRRKPKRLFDSLDSSEKRHGALWEGNLRKATRTRNRGKCSVRYHEDSDDNKNPRPSSEATEKGKETRRTVGPRNGKDRFKRNFTASSDEDEAAAIPNYMKSSRGRIRKIVR